MSTKMLFLCISTKTPDWRNRLLNTNFNLLEHWAIIVNVTLIMYHLHLKLSLSAQFRSNNKFLQHVISKHIPLKYSDELLKKGEKMSEK